MLYQIPQSTRMQLNPLPPRKKALPDILKLPMPKTTYRFLRQHQTFIPSNWHQTRQPSLIKSDGTVAAKPLKLAKNSSKSKPIVPIIVHGKVARMPGTLSSTGKLRILALEQVFVNGNLSDCVPIIVFTGHQGEAKALERCFAGRIADYNLGLSKIEILLEENARNTLENAEFSCALLKTKGIEPDVIVPCSQDWHLLRMCQNNILVPEKSEFQVYQREFPQAKIELLWASYPYCERTQEDWLRWQAEFHIYTHFLSPLISLLWGIQEQQINDFRSSVVDLFNSSYRYLCASMDLEPASAPENRDIQQIWSKHQEELDKIALTVSSWSGLNVSQILAQNYQKETQGRNWKDYTHFVSDIINALRWPSDPDRT